MKDKSKMQCATCNGEEVYCTARVYWDYDKQQWLTEEVYCYEDDDDIFCADCDDNVHINEVREKSTNPYYEWSEDAILEEITDVESSMVNDYLNENPSNKEVCLKYDQLNDALQEFHITKG